MEMDVSPDNWDEFTFPSSYVEMTQGFEGESRLEKVS